MNSHREWFQDGLFRVAALALAAFLGHAAWAAAGEPATGTLVDLTAQASRNAPNDLARAVLFAEMTDASPAELSRRVNAAIAGALKEARSAPAVKTRSGSSYTQPVYSKSGQRIESWRMRSELVLESKDLGALSELVGKLQANLGVSQLQLQPSNETRKAAEDEAMLEAIAAFRVRAKLVADALGKGYRIRQLQLGGSSHRPPPYPVQRSALAEAAMPIEAGETAVTVTASGQIELTEP